MKIIIKGLGPVWDGEHEFDLDLTNRDLHEIKQISGVRAGEFEEAFEAMDNDLVVAVASIVLRKHGKRAPLDVLWDAPLGAIKLDLDEAETVEDDAGPPSQTPTEPESPETLSGVSETSGNGSSESSDLPARIRPVTGVPSSDTTSGSDPPTSAI
jgi:hypothetical protein